MALPTGLLPALAFALTAGVAVSVRLGAALIRRRGIDEDARALRSATKGVAVLYLAGVAGLWGLTGFGALWGLPAALVAAGLAALGLLVALPLSVGEWLLRHGRGLRRDEAWGYAADGWVVAMVLVFLVFVAPGGPAGGTLFDLGGPRICLAGVCGLSVPFLGAVVLEFLLAVLGPGVVGLLLHASRIGPRRPRVES